MHAAIAATAVKERAMQTARRGSSMWDSRFFGPRRAGHCRMKDVGATARGAGAFVQLQTARIRFELFSAHGADGRTRLHNRPAARRRSRPTQSRLLMNRAAPELYLASQSPRRLQLLLQLGVRATLLLASEDEDAESLEAVRRGETAEAYVRRVTRAKLDAARLRMLRRGLRPAPILCADTTVALGRSILGKPTDAAHARTMLRRLSGRTHRVVSGVAVAVGTRTLAALSVSRVRLAVLPPAVIQAYLASGDPFGKAGAYAIQGALAGWITHIEGSHSGIVGLPLYETAQLLRRAGVATSLTS
jgi:septum formation protein